jgi:hypothetical protein
MMGRRLAARQRVPDVPNFRDYGMTVAGDLLRILGNLQKNHGYAWASEAGLRSMIEIDTGHLPGVGTIPQALDRLEVRGAVRQFWLVRGGILPDGDECKCGTRLVILPQNRRERRAFVINGKRGKREMVTFRSNRAIVASVEQAKKQIAKAMTPLADGDLARRKQSDLARLADLAAQWAREPKPDKPPD